MSVLLAPRSGTAAAQGWARWRAGVLLLLVAALQAGCAAARRDPPAPAMPAVAHEHAAEMEQRRAGQAEGVSASAGGALLAEAARHREAAEALRRAAEALCPAPALESEGVFSLVTAVVLEVRPMMERPSSRAPRPTRGEPRNQAAGAVIVVATRLPPEDVLAGLQCQVARSRVTGGSAADPAAVAGATLLVRSPSPGVVHVEVHADDDDTAQEVLHRARRLMGH